MFMSAPATPLGKEKKIRRLPPVFIMKRKDISAHISFVCLPSCSTPCRGLISMVCPRCTFLRFRLRSRFRPRVPVCMRQVIAEVVIFCLQYEVEEPECRGVTVGKTSFVGTWLWRGRQARYTTCRQKTNNVAFL